MRLYYSHLLRTQSEGVILSLYTRLYITRWNDPSKLGNHTISRFYRPSTVNAYDLDATKKYQRVSCCKQASMQ
jgi:hypothetical protein